MTWHFPPYAAAYLINTIFAALSCFFAWRHRAIPGAAALAFLMLAIVDWTLLQALEVMAVETWAKIFWAKLEYTGIAPVGVLWLLFAARFTNQDRWVTRKTAGLLLVIPALSVLAAFSNEWHFLLWSGVTIVSPTASDFIIYHHGPWFWVSSSYTYVMLLIGSFLLVRAIAKYPQLYRKQATPLMLGVAIPWAANLVYLTGNSPVPGMDLTPFAFTIVGVIYFWSIFRSRLFEIVPIARDLLIENIYDGMIVLDTMNRVIDLNPAAREFFSLTGASIGKKAETVLGPLSPLVTRPVGSTVQHVEVTVERETPRTLTFDISPLADRYGQPCGHLIMMRDVTDQRKAREKLGESERRYREHVEEIGDIVYVLDANRNIKYVNATLGKYIGYPLDGSDRKRFEEIITPQSYDRLSALFGQPGSTDEQRIFEIGLTGADNEERIFEVSEKYIEEGGTTAEIHGIGRDITERKRAEDALRESEQRYRLLAENANDIIFTMDADLRFTYISPSVTRIRGFTVEEAMSQTPAEALTPDSLKAAIQVFDEAMAVERNGTGPRVRTRVLELEETCKDGSTVWTETTFSALRDEKGAFSGLLGITRDITERKRAEYALKESEERYRALYNDNPSMYFTVSEEGTVLSVNPYGAEQLGYAVEELLGQPVLGVFYEADRAAVAEQMQISLKKPGQVAQWEFRKTRKDGSVLWVREAARAVRQADGRSVVLIVCEDVTDRKTVEEAMRESEAKFRNVFETSRDLMYITALDGTIIDYNMSAKEFFGYSDEEIKGMTVLDVFRDPEDRAKLVEKLKAEGFVQNYALKLKKKDGSLIDALGTIAVRRDSRGDIIGFQGSVKDITQMRSLERQLLQAEKLSGLGTMLSGIAHEMNNPLTSIMGNAELMLRDKTLPKSVVRSSEVIFKESERAAKIVSGLLTFAREHKQERSMVNVNDIIRESYKLKEYNLRVSNIRVRLSLADGLPRTYADPYQLQQVFVNMINNAHDALADKNGGTITTSSARRGDMLVIEFTDDGPGIEKNKIKKIFDPFFTTKEVGKGTGLGLSMSYGIIEEHGGRIDVESEPGMGATFTVSIPVAAGPRRETEPAVEKRNRHVGQRILVVDDERSIRNFLSDTLSAKGHIVETASSGEEALALIGKASFDAILLDIKMPGMEGKQLYAHILNSYPEKATRILFVTGDILGEDTQAFLRVTGSKSIAKPFKIEALYRMLDEMLEQ